MDWSWRTLDTGSSIAIADAYHAESMQQIDTTATHQPQNFDFTFSADLYFPGTTSHQAGMYFRYQDAANYYVFHLEEGQGPTSSWAAVFGRIVNNSFTKLAGVAINETVAINKTYGLKVESAGSTYTFYLDKGAGFEQIMQATSSTFTGGPLGLRGNGARGARWDNILVKNNDVGAPNARLRSTETPPDEKASKFMLGDNYPNPFSDHTRIDFVLPLDSPVKLEIFNLHGQLVKTLVDKEFGSGSHIIEWDRRGNSGGKVSPGLYLYRMRALGFKDSKRLIIQ